MGPDMWKRGPALAIGRPKQNEIRRVCFVCFARRAQKNRKRIWSNNRMKPFARISILYFVLYFLKRGDIRSTMAVLTIMRCLCLFQLRMTVLRMNLYLLALIDGETQF